MVPNLQVAFIHFGQLYLPGKRLLKSTGVGNPQEDVFF